ncbi:MAG: helix-turn-helix domain-containing protein [Bacillota bacterium]
MKVSEFLKNVGDRIRTIRKHRGLTQESLAEKTGLQNTYIRGTANKVRILYAKPRLIKKTPVS